ncbi:hypothetical protein ACCO45_007183 [Purpureocillium lilacinum]|uniref:Uncharacterized protein n=1 Tax=Purpureocillium lilacinum TaxID=33203 RepID=A0ACC4DUC5_PURLI
MTFEDPLRCTDAPKSTPSDAGIAGTGILLSFMATAGLAIILSATVIVGEMRGKPSTIRRKLLSGYSDSQILQGIGIQSVGLAKMNSLVPYHFFLIWMLSLLSMATHNATLLALVRDYRRDWVIRWLRQFLMFVNLALSSVSGAFVLQAVSKGMERSTLPIACVWQVAGDGAAPNASPLLCGHHCCHCWKLHHLRSGNVVSAQPCAAVFQGVQLVGLLLMAAIAVGAAIRIGLLSQAFGRPSVTLSDQGEKVWSFGQLLSMLLLVYPLVNVVGNLQGRDERRRILRRGEEVTRL